MNTVTMLPLRAYLTFCGRLPAILSVAMSPRRAEMMPLTLPKQSGAPSRPQVPLALLEQCQDRLAQSRRAGGRFKSPADPAKQAGIGSGPNVGVTVFEKRGDVQTGQALVGPEVRHLLTLPAKDARAIRSAPHAAVT
jgi:hypothetical protein